MTKSSLSSKYHNLKVRKSHNKCIVAIAHKLIRIIYFMLAQREPYRDPGVNYEAMSAQKNAPRWSQPGNDRATEALSEKVHTITSDNGREFAGHEEIAK